MPLAVKRRPRSGSPDSASAWRQRMRSIRFRISWAWRIVVGQAIEQSLLRGDRVATSLGLLPVIAAVGSKLPCVPVIGKVGLESLVDHSFFEVAIEHGKRDFHAPEQ